MTPTKKRLLSIGAALATPVVVWSMITTQARPGHTRPVTAEPTPQTPSASPVEPAEVAAPSPARGEAPGAVSYAIAVPELHGLSPHAAPGTELQVWVAWEPPISKEPRIHRLVDSVILEEITPPLLPDGPHVAMLLVPRKELRNLLYGDRYGALSVAVSQRSGNSG